MRCAAVPRQVSAKDLADRIGSLPARTARPSRRQLRQGLRISLSAAQSNRAIFFVTPRRPKHAELSSHAAAVRLGLACRGSRSAAYEEMYSQNFFFGCGTAAEAERKIRHKRSVRIVGTSVESTCLQGIVEAGTVPSIWLVFPFTYRNQRNSIHSPGRSARTLCAGSIPARASNFSPTPEPPTFYSSYKASLGRSSP